jgi:hypothetical protein
MSVEHRHNDSGINGQMQGFVHAEVTLLKLAALVFISSAAKPPKSVPFGKPASKEDHLRQGHGEGTLIHPIHRRILGMPPVIDKKRKI